MNREQLDAAIARLERAKVLKDRAARSAERSRANVDRANDLYDEALADFNATCRGLLSFDSRPVLGGVASNVACCVGERGCEDFTNLDSSLDRFVALRRFAR